MLLINLIINSKNLKSCLITKWVFPQKQQKDAISPMHPSSTLGTIKITSCKVWEDGFISVWSQYWLWYSFLLEYRQCVRTENAISIQMFFFWVDFTMLCSSRKTLSAAKLHVNTLTFSLSRLQSFTYTITSQKYWRKWKLLRTVDKVYHRSGS